MANRVDLLNQYLFRPLGRELRRTDASAIDPMRSLRRLFRHTFNVGSRPRTILDVANGRPTPSLFRVLRDVSYVAFDPASGLARLVLTSARWASDSRAAHPPAEPSVQHADIYHLDTYCSRLRLTSPYVLRLCRNEAYEAVLKGAPQVLAECELLLLDLPVQSGVADHPLDALAPILRKAGLMLYDVWGATTWQALAHAKPQRYATFLFVREGSSFAAPLAFVKQARARHGGTDPMVHRPEVAGVRSCLVLGTGRSGTSMLSGILYEAGYYMGENLYLGRDTNPKGFFECAMINYLNEDILRRYDDQQTPFAPGRGGGGLRPRRYRPRAGQRWLAALDTTVEVSHTSEEIRRRIREACSRTPFAYKDPRFSYTLPVWAPHLPRDTQLLVIFRDPRVTVRSILKEVREMPYLRSLPLDEATAYEIYRLEYEHILARRPAFESQMVFVHYDQIFDGTALPRLAERLGIPLTARFVDKRLKRTRAEGSAPAAVMRLYHRLCGLAGARPGEAT